MLNQITGLHHVTSLASGARANNRFFTATLGLRRVKTTVNFDAPDVYHLYYGDELGRPGTVMTYFPFPRAARGRRGIGEIATTAFAVPRGAAAPWAARLGVGNADSGRFGETRLAFEGPDGERFALVEADDQRLPWTGGDIAAGEAIRGFHSVSLRLADAAATAELLHLMGYREQAREGEVIRYAVAEGGAAQVIDIEVAAGAPAAVQGAGSVHHVAFTVADRARQGEVRAALADAGWQVTPVIDRDYFWSIYFRSPGGVLFEVATAEPGFAIDEDIAHLGRALQLPAQHRHLRARLEAELEPIEE